MIPTLPAFFDMVYTEANGKLAPDGYLYNDQMFQALNALVILVNGLTTSIVQGASDVTINGLNPPPKTTAEITALLPSVTNGTMFYNSDLKKLQFKADAGVIETITSS
jgi:hypothetical protein